MGVSNPRVLAGSDRSGDANGKSQNKSQTRHHQQQNSAAAAVATSRAPPPHRQPTAAFEMTNDEIKAQEFDFEENLAMFEKREFLYN